MPRDVRVVEAALLAKGFKKRYSDHKYFVYETIDGKLTSVKTKTSHTPSHKSLGDDLLGRMARQCQLSKGEFLDLVDCPLSRPAYETILSSKSLT